MSRVLSLNARQALDAQASDEVEVVLFRITHPDLADPIRLSTDNLDVIDAEAGSYGTRSSWGGANPLLEPYLWIVASAVIPGDDAEGAAAAQIVLENLDARIIELLRSFTEPASVDLAVVLATSPDLVEDEYLGLQLSLAEGDEASITLSLLADEIELEAFPSGRMSRHKFPGLHL